MRNNIPETNIEQRLDELKEVPARNPLQTASGRARFLNEATEYKQAVSPERQVRQSGWIFKIRKEKFAMNALVTLILVASLLLGGGATVAAAQDDLPNQSLYQLKLWTENAKLAMTGEPQDHATLLMNMAQTRVQEIATLAEMGITPSDQVRERLEQHLNQTLMLAANMDEATLTQTLLQLQSHLQTQDQIMQQLQLHTNAETEPLLTRTRQMLQTQLQLVNDGLADPQGFHYMVNNQMRYGQDEEISPEPNQQGGPDSQQNGQAGQGAEEPGNGNDYSGDNPDASQGSNAGNGSGNEAPSGQNPESPQGGNGSWSGNGNGSGGKP